MAHIITKKRNPIYLVKEYHSAGEKLRLCFCLSLRLDQKPHRKSWLRPHSLNTLTEGLATFHSEGLQFCWACTANGLQSVSSKSLTTVPPFLRTPVKKSNELFDILIPLPSNLAYPIQNRDSFPWDCYRYCSNRGCHQLPRFPARNLPISSPFLVLSIPQISLSSQSQVIRPVQFSSEPLKPPFFKHLAEWLTSCTLEL